MSEPVLDAPPATPAPAPAAGPSERQRRATAWIVAIAVIGSMVHQIGPVFKWKGTRLEEVTPRLWEWYIEDAAITFAYARNLMAGDGLVAFPGGERIEGFTNATWTYLIALGHLFGVDGFTSAKWMALAFGGATVVLTWKLVAEIVDDAHAPAAWFAPVILACFPNFAFWNASGLENPVFNFFLAGGLWRTAIEVKRGGVPWAALWFCGLALSRPDGLMYAAVAGFFHLLGAVSQRRGLGSSVAWIALFFVPYGAYKIWSYLYFAWFWPNTYYAKMLNDKIAWTSFAGGGFKYVRNWAWETNTGWFLPVFAAGLVGLRGLRRWAVLGFTLVAAFGFFYPSAPAVEALEGWPKDLWLPEGWNQTDGWNTYRSLLLYGLALALPLFVPWTPSGLVRALLWYSATLTLFFCIYATGDWMKGFRWMSFLSVPLAALLALGIAEVGSLVQRLARRRDAWGAPGWIAAVVLLVAVMPGFFLHSGWFFGKRETGPFSVKRRVEYTDWVLERLWVQDRLVRNLDVDMGAHLFWSPTQMVDMAGLVDVSVAHHSFKQRPFITEYVFTEKQPSVAHVHGGWAAKSRIPTYPEWKRDYVEIPGFPISSKTNHMGHHVRRDLMLVPSWSGTPGREVRLADGVTLAGFEVPSPEVSVGKAFYLEVGVRYRRLEEREDFRVVGFLSNADGQVFSFDLPPAYDWVPPRDWRVGEVFHGRFSFVLPDELGPGVFDLGFVVIGQDGRVLPLATDERVVGRTIEQVPAAVPPGVEVGGPDTSRFMVGEVRFPGVVTIGDAGTGEAAAEQDLAEALRLAADGACAPAEAAWRLAWLHLPRATEWRTERRGRFADAVAACWVAVARAAVDPLDAVQPLESARYWNRRVDGLWEVADRVGDALHAAGEAARAQGDWEGAYTGFDGAVRADPRRSWARRYAEEARDQRLGLVVPEAAPVVAEPEPVPVGGEGE